MQTEKRKNHSRTIQQFFKCSLTLLFRPRSKFVNTCLERVFENVKRFEQTEKYKWFYTREEKRIK